MKKRFLSFLCLILCFCLFVSCDLSVNNGDGNADIEASPEREPEPDTEPESESEIELEVESQSEFESQSELESETEFESESESESETEFESESESESESASESVTGDGDAPERVYKIYIDQGHNPTGYHNSGASKEGVYEENITYVVGAALAELLSADERFEVRLSRPTPETVLGVDGVSSLEARVQGAKDFGADYFISIHANSYSGVEDVWGYECFTLTTDAEMKAFGSTVLNALHKEINTRNRGLKDGGSLHVIKNAAVPAMLIELGFLTNETERTYMTAAPGRYASAIYAGIVDFIENVKPSFPDNEPASESECE